MNLLPSPEQTEIVDSSAAFLRDRLPISRTRELLDHAPIIDPDAWQAAADLGWFALGLPESHGGVGCGLADEALLFREIGRSLATGPFLSTLLAARVASLGGHEALADEIIGGRRVGLAIPGSADLLVDGSVTGDLQMLDTDVDERALVLVVDDDAAAIVAVAEFDDVRTVPCYDNATFLQRATATHATALVAVSADVDQVCRRGHVLAASMLTGITEACLGVSTEHAKTRVQFDKPVGVHQAVKHPCADMAVRAQLSFAQTLFAALAHDEARPDAEFQALSAQIVAAEAAEFSAAATIQIMAGLGFTFEHDAHLYAKRSYVLSLLFGGTGAQLGRLLSQPEPV